MSDALLAKQPGARDTLLGAHPAAVVVIGASAGGFQALRTVVGSLSPALPAAIFVVLHTRPTHISQLAGILARSGALPASTPRDGQTVEAGHIYVALPDHHLTIDEGRIRIAKDGREHFTRPAVDPLFRSACHEFGKGVIGVVLSGMGKNGAAGMLAIKLAGGTTIVQDPKEAEFSSMPRAAIRAADPDFVLSADQIGPLINQLCADLAAIDLAPA